MKLIKFDFIYRQALVAPLYFLIFISYLVIGWFLNGYGASLISWLGTIAVLCYTIRSGIGALVLASFWVVALSSHAILHYSWLDDLPLPKQHINQFIYSALLFNWLFSLIALWFLAAVSDYLRKGSYANTVICNCLAGLVLMGMATGWVLYDDTAPFLCHIIEK
jgi:hypothetical protein